MGIRALLFALGSLPFVVPLHLRPITSFYGEWLAALLTLILFAVLLAARRGRTLRLPWILLLPTVFLAVIGLQLAAGRIYFPQQALIHAAYLLLAAVAMIAGATIKEEIGAAPAATALAGGFAIGALLQATICALQIQDIVLPGWTTPLDGGHRAYGNLGQLNLLADYFWLGVVSLLLLRARGAISYTSAAAAALAIMLAAPLTGSRSTLLYPLVVGALGLLLIRRAHADPGPSGLIKSFLLLAPAGVILAIAVSTLTARVVPDGGDAVGRVLAAAGSPNSPSVRIDLLRTGLAAAWATPWLGGGVGAVPLQSLEFGHHGGRQATFGAAEHFHNLPVNWAAEFGFPAALVALAICLRLALTLALGRPGLERYWALAVFAIVGTHSMLEYPLWHSFFIVPLSLLAGAAAPSRANLRLRPPMLLALGAAMLLGLNLLNQLRVDHNGLARVSHVVPSGPDAQAIWRSHLDELLHIHRTSLFSPYVAGMLVVAFDNDREKLAEKSTLCEAAIRLSPAPEVLFKCALNDALSGANDRARERLRLAVTAFPQDAATWGGRLIEAASEYPELASLQDLLPPASPPARLPSGSG